MQAEEQLLKKRFTELSARAQRQCDWTYSDFLTPYEQNLLFECVRENEVTLCGGYECAERRIACFGSEDLCLCAPSPPILCVKASPRSQKFADELTHRDFLGSVMGIGIRRETVGDIVLTENCGYIFCSETVAPFLCETLDKVKHTSVECAVETPPKEITQPEGEEKTVVVSSSRLDAAVAAVYDLSRNESAALIVGKRVFIGGKLVENTSLTVKDDSTVSVRGYGRFVWCGNVGTTKKQRLRVRVKVF